MIHLFAGLGCAGLILGAVLYVMIKAMLNWMMWHRNSK